MKNIHVLPTDNPSRLLKTIPKGNLILSKLITSGSHWENQNIYITSDEEINLNDYITDGYRVWKWKDDSSLLGRKKIILTTDQDLIKDGVQAIDNEFLEWFVKNPSCQYGGYKDINWDKIITLKEEPKQDYSKIKEGLKKSIEGKAHFIQHFKNGGTVEEFKPLEPKQETLEEAFEQWSDKQTGYDKLDVLRFGAKWQQERMYSEAIEFGKWLDNNIQQREYYPMKAMTIQELFEKFKKK